MSTLFEHFGGIRRMAEHLNEAPSTVQGWKAAGRIPSTKQPTVLAKAQEVQLDVTAEDVIFPLRERVRARSGDGGMAQHAPDDTWRAQQASCGSETIISDSDQREVA